MEDTKEIFITEKEILGVYSDLSSPKILLLIEKGAPLLPISGKVKDDWYLALHEVNLWKEERYIFKRKPHVGTV